MEGKIENEELRTLIEAGHYARAAHLASRHGLPDDQIEELRRKALWQMAAVYRNVHGTKTLARQFGIPGEELRDVLSRWTEEMGDEGTRNPLEPCYDYHTGKYLSFQEWLERFF
ncbi:MAG: hypothetical protein JRJ78_00550 [Deltaproteobacteria bacterium]|nr:hypothetical protein [Deltaproteobacteria bacterium]MBW2016515.1 hypothetical protein [Deltaproteobacteria bacterium]